ncbi:MAG: hypothetical protein KDA80_19710 [Planctomycetaceae bacterium]|nr:hypothetical protein [Planctomycetaceae bacterium]
MRKPPPPSHKPGRSGWTLVECLSVISVMAVISVAGTKMIILLMNLDTGTAQDVAQRVALERLEDALRGDLRFATDVEPTNPGDGTTVLAVSRDPEESVRYVFSSGRVQRTIGEGRGAPREAFVLPGFDFDLLKDESLLRLTIQRDARVTADDQFLATSKNSRRFEFVIRIGVPAVERAEEDQR